MPLRCIECGREWPAYHAFCGSCGHPLARPSVYEARPDILAMLVTSQDQVTWLAFSLAMTVEALLGIAYVGEVGILHGRLFVSVAGAFLGLVFLLLVLRSNADMAALYAKGSVVDPHSFNIPRAKRIGPTATDVMTASLVVWISVWIAAFFHQFAVLA